MRLRHSFGYGTTDEQVTEIIESIKQNTAIQSVSFLGLVRFESAEVWQHFVEALVDHPSIREVTLNLSLCLQKIQILADVFRQRESIQIFKLDLSDNSETSLKGYAILLDLLQQPNQTIQNLSLKRSILCTGTEEERTAIGRVFRSFLQQNTTLQQLDISNNNLGSVLCSDIAFGLLHNTSLQSLEYCRNNVDDNTAIVFAEYFRNHQTQLNNLMLDRNQIGDDGAVALIRSISLSSSFKLKKLSLNDNRITPNGFKVIGSLLRYNTTLEYLSVRDINCTCLDKIPCIKALQYNSTLKELHIDGRQGNFISEEDFSILEQVILETLQSNDSITYIRYWNNIGLDQATEDGETIVNVLRENSLTTRIAPRKGYRQRFDIYNWLLSQIPEGM